MTPTITQGFSEVGFYKTFPVISQDISCQDLFPVSSEEKAALAVELSFPKPDCRPSNNFCSEKKQPLLLSLVF